MLLHQRRIESRDRLWFNVRVTEPATITMDAQPAPHAAEAPQPPALSPPPLALDQFQIGKALGRGRFGQVYLAHHVPTGTDVALKCLSKALLQRGGAVQLLKREVEVHSRLAHPHVLPFRGFFQDAHRVYVALELATEGTLYGRLKAARAFPPADAAAVVAALADALAYIHAHSCCHRDLKPENVLLLAGGVPAIADFGWAVHDGAGGSMRRTSLAGTLEYAAPEVLRGSSATGSGGGTDNDGATHGPPVDVWSLGCLAFELLAGPGRSPFAVRDPDTGALDDVATVRNIEAGAWAVPSTVDADGTLAPAFPPAAVDFIGACLAVDPAARPTAAQLLGHEWLAPHVRPGAAEAAAATAAATAAGAGGGLTFELSSSATSSPSSASAMATSPPGGVGATASRLSRGVAAATSRSSTGSAGGGGSSSTFGSTFRRVASSSSGVVAGGYPPLSPPVRVVATGSPGTTAPVAAPPTEALGVASASPEGGDTSSGSHGDGGGLDSAAWPSSAEASTAIPAPPSMPAAATSSGSVFSPRRTAGLKGAPRRVRASVAPPLPSPADSPPLAALGSGAPSAGAAAVPNDTAAAPVSTPPLTTAAAVASVPASSSVRSTAAGAAHRLVSPPLRGATGTRRPLVFSPLQQQQQAAATAGGTATTAGPGGGASARAHSAGPQTAAAATSQLNAKLTAASGTSPPPAAAATAGPAVATQAAAASRLRFRAASAGASPPTSSAPAAAVTSSVVAPAVAPAAAAGSRIPRRVFR